MSTSGKKITLKSSDGETFEVDVEVARESVVIKNMIEYDCNYVDSAIPITNVTGKILGKVIEYCEKHVGEASNTRLHDPVVSNELKAWDASFVMVDNNTLFDLILAANFLNLKKLMDLASETVANKLKGKSPEEIRKVFGIKDEFTPEEKEEVRKENQWAFE